MSTRTKRKSALTRPVADWVEILKPHYDKGDGLSAADRIFGDLTGYRHSSNYRDDDCEQLVAAMEAWYLLSAGRVR